MIVVGKPYISHRLANEENQHLSPVTEMIKAKAFFMFWTSGDFIVWLKMVGEKLQQVQKKRGTANLEIIHQRDFIQLSLYTKSPADFPLARVTLFSIKGFCEWSQWRGELTVVHEDKDYHKLKEVLSDKHDELFVGVRDLELGVRS